MIKKLLLTGLSILCFGLHAQTVLNTPVTTSQTVVDPVSVTMQSGFSVNSNPNIVFAAKTGTTSSNNPTICNQYGKVVISEIHFDTHYNERIEDKYHFFGEYIELFNSSTSPVDLTGWIIKDNHTEFVLTADAVNGNFIIPPGGHKIITYGGFRYYGAMSYTDPWPGTAGGAQSAIGGRAKFEELFPDVLTASGYNAANDVILQNTMVLFNLEDKVSIHAPNGKLVDQVTYRQDQVNNNLHLGYDDTNWAVIGPYLSNDDGGVFNGPMGGIPARDPVTGNYILDVDGNRTYSGIDNNLKKAIYRSTVEGYYTGGSTTFAIATASPGSNPQIVVPLMQLDPYMTTLTLTNPNNDNNTESIAYDIKDGSIIGHSKTYFDELGKPKVFVSKDFQTNLTWGTEMVYDDFGRQWKQSFPTPTCMGFDNIKYLSDTTYKSQFLDKYYSDNNAYETHQATAEQPYSQINYDDSLNPGNIINLVGGNKIDNEWKSSYSYTVPAAQEMYYAFGSSHFYDNRDVNYYCDMPGSSKIYPDYDGLGLTAYRIKVVTSDNDLAPLPYTNAASLDYFDMKANSPLEIGKIYKVLRYGYPTYVQILEQTGPFRNTQNLWPSMKILEGNWSTFSEISQSISNDAVIQETQTVLNDPNKIIAGLKCVKNIMVDANGVENVSFTDSDGKILAAARSGGTQQYPVTSLVGKDGFVDIHLPKGCDGTLTFIGGASLYKVFDMRNGNVLTAAEKANLVAGVYRVELINAAVQSNLTYIDKTTGSIGVVSANGKGVNYKVNYYDYSLNIYNNTGQLIKILQPNGYQQNATIVMQPAHMQPMATAFITTFAYNGQGQVKEMISPDEGTYKFAYRNDGQIRYSQNLLQSDSKVSYTNYDELARPVESGVITGTTGIWVQASVDPDGALISTPGLAFSEQTGTIYDYPENNTTSVAIPSSLTLANVLAAEGINTVNYLQENLYGNIAITFGKNGSTINAVSWYSYDAYGRVNWIVQYAEGLGAKTIHYEYDYKGNVNKVIYQKDKATELFVHRYTYDLNNILVKVETSTDNTAFITHADYEYYVSGELKRVNIAQGTQGLDYVYTLEGQLKSINHPSLEQAKDPGHDGNDVFGVMLDYHNGDYQRANTNIGSSSTIAGVNQDFNGNVKAVRWSNKNDIVGGVANQRAYMYNYNRNGWLADATFGTTNNAGVITTSGMFKEGAITYDANGNIKSLQRTNETGLMIDNLAYDYTTKNQLSRVNDMVASNVVSYDVDSQSPNNYEYNAIGQLWKNNAEGLEYFYNSEGLTTEVRKGGNTIVKFFYNEHGYRISKESYNISGVHLYTDYYVLDVGGNVMAIYNKPAGGIIKQKELSIYGLSRLAIYTKAPLPINDYITYEIADHLGNVRAVIKKIINNPVVAIFTSDYYPFGEKLPSRDNMTNEYRYAFQGQELDGGTGMEAFQLRLWDGRIGRWLNPDPYSEFFSPYLGMGNNPINLVDPDGGAVGGPEFPSNPEKGQIYSHCNEGTTWTYEFDGKSWIGIGAYSVIEEVVIKSGPTTSGWSRFTGGLQMIGGVAEIVVGGVGGILTAETGVGAAVGYAVFMNGIDNAVTGAKQLWTGRDQDTYLHKGTYATAKFAGASNETAENIATGADIATIALGGGSSLKNAKKLKPMLDFSKMKHGKWQVGLRAINTKKHFRIERHLVQARNGKLLRTHFNYGVNGAKHFFIRNAKELKQYAK
ncbi:lamin tail domain-containing protein [Flavobacterium amniphilum]|uniref:lamin tail domain-containing protein n=1 Tax=Flavobacterium amniphilum TaxID=1834035 RepID=UPI00202A7D15|nr:RHS repeat-associated core domain-containing protein [Flavobacterium amniphilum]MCL9806424.1 lamin tail domain-containing protein [Flavobacterium amniphilum]